MEIFSFILIVALCVGSGVFGGLQLRDYFADMEAEDAPKKAINGGLAILVGIVLAVSFFLVFESKGRTEAVTTPTGAWKNNQEQVLPSKEELERRQKEREIEEWGEVNQKSHQEIRDEANKAVQDAVERNK